MSNKRINIGVLTTGDYTFNISERQIVVATKKKDPEELKIITQLYDQWRYKYYKYPGRPLNGEFRLCRNPECNNAFYAMRFRIEQGQASFCCCQCSGKVTGCPKGQQIGKIINKSDRLTKTKEMACWILDTVFYKDPERIEQLNLLLKISDKETKSALNEIFSEIPGCGPVYLMAREIIESYIQSEEGKGLRIPIQTLVGILFFIPNRSEPFSKFRAQYCLVNRQSGGFLVE